MTFMPDDFRRGMVSGDGASTKSTCPASKAAAAGRRLRHRDQHEPVVLGHPRRVPVVLVLDQLQALARHDPVELVGPGAGRRLGILRVVEVGLLDRALRDHVPDAQIVRRERVRRLREDRDGAVVDLLGVVDVDRAHAVARVVDRVEALRLVVDQALDVPHHQVGRQVAAVVELHALAQLDDPSLVVGGIDGPLGRRGPASAAPPGRSGTDPS